MNSLKSGFTLLELIVAMGITALIGYFILSIGQDFVSVWEDVGDSVARETEARSALDAIARDFESAFFREGSEVMFAVDSLDDDSNAGAKWEDGAAERPSSDGSDPEVHEYGWTGSWVRLFSASPSLNAVGYQIVRSTIKDGVGTPRYMLYRNVELHKNTVANAESGAGYDLSHSVYTNNGYIGGMTRENILAVNVIDFGVRLYIRDLGDPSDEDAPDGLRLIFPADGSSELVTSVSNLSHAARTFEGTTYGQRYPDVVEVFLRVLSDEGADLISDMEEAGANADWEEVAERHSKLYRRYIVIGGEGES